MARFCGEIIFASTPPEELAAPNRYGEAFRLVAACVCRPPNSWVEPASVPGMATPNQPTIGARKAKKPPDLDRNRPRGLGWPENCMTKASANTARSVTLAQLN